MTSVVSNIWIMVSILILLAAMFIFIAAFSPLPKSYRAQRQQGDLNIKLYDQSLAELSVLLEANDLTLAQFEEQKNELDYKLSTDLEGLDSTAKINNGGRSVLYALVLFLPFAAGYLYFDLGATKQLAELQARNETREVLKTSTDPIELAKGLNVLLAEKPQNAEGWYMLANVQMQNNELDKAIDSFQRAQLHVAEYSPLNNIIAGTYAQALFFTDGSFTTRVETAIDNARKINPSNPAALSLLGIQAFESEKYQQAIEHWNQALKSVDKQEAGALQSGIDSARLKLAADPSFKMGPQLKVSIRLAKGLEAGANRNGNNTDPVVFIYAREPGQRMPLLAKKINLSDIPTQIFLDKTSAINPDTDLEKYPILDIVAHVAFAGVPGKKAGDFLGEELGLNLQKSLQGNAEQLVAIELAIDRIVQ